MGNSRPTLLPLPDGRWLQIPSISYSRLYYYSSSKFGHITNLETLQQALNSSEPIDLQVVRENRWYSLDYEQCAWIIPGTDLRFNG
jgi:hypothetical protein